MKFNVYVLTKNSSVGGGDRRIASSDRAKHVLEEAEDLLKRLRPGESLKITVEEETLED